ncbi:MAG: radical SAM protein [Nitrososphaerales archaeon]|nr:radical SAM protein [Nitrososphaerales archaeon]
MVSVPGIPIVLTAPLSEIIDNAGFFIQMSLASIPAKMEWIIDWKYPDWRRVAAEDDGSARVAPAGLRVLEEVLGREFGCDKVVVCYPEQLPSFLGPQTRVVAISAHNPLGTTFAAGVYASIFGSSREPANSVYARKIFETVRNHPHRKNFKVVLGGPGSWQIGETDTQDRFGIDCVVDGRAEAAETIELFYRIMNGEEIPRQLAARHPNDLARLVIPRRRTSFGVIEMTTGCGRRCSFCQPDLNPRLSFPKDEIMKAVAGNVAAGNRQISLATEDMFVWRTDEAGLPFFVPNRRELLDLFQSIAAFPGVEHVTLSHCTIAPALVDPNLIAALSQFLLDRSPIRMKAISTHPEGRALSPLIGIETGSVRMAKKIMAGKALPFDIEHWPHIVLEGLEILNRNNWFPVATLIVGSPDETDADSMETLDMLYEAERRGLHCLWVPSIFTPFVRTRMEKTDGVRETRQLTKLQWQVIMKAWRMTSDIGLQSTFGKFSFGVGSLVLWATRLRRLNGPNFTWPLLQFSRLLPENLLHRTGRLYSGKPMPRITRDELIRTVRPGWQEKIAEAQSEGFGAAAAS